MRGARASRVRAAKRELERAAGVGTWHRSAPMAPLQGVPAAATAPCFNIWTIVATCIFTLGSRSVILPVGAF